MYLLYSFNKYIEKQYNTSLLSTDESLALKRLMILLVLLRHNTYLMTYMYAYKLLYSLHVYAFFYLPLLYNHKKESLLHSLSKNLLLYIPYTFVFALLLIINIKTSFNVKYTNIHLAYIYESTSHFFKIGGFLWFVSTLFSLLLLKQIYYMGNNICRYSMLTISFICLICLVFGFLGS